MECFPREWLLLLKGNGGAGIAFVTVIAWIPGHGASYLGASSAIPGLLQGATSTVPRYLLYRLSHVQSLGFCDSTWRFVESADSH